MVSGKTIGRWEGCIMNFCVSFAEDFAIHSSAYLLDRGSGDQMLLIDVYSPQKTPSLISWQVGILERILSAS